MQKSHNLVCKQWKKLQIVSHSNQDWKCAILEFRKMIYLLVNMCSSKTIDNTKHTVIFCIIFAFKNKSSFRTYRLGNLEGAKFLFFKESSEMSQMKA